MYDCALHVMVERDYQAAQLRGAADLLQKLEEAFSADQVELLGQVNEGEVKRLPLFPAFFLDLADSEDHVNDGSSSPEATLELKTCFRGQHPPPSRDRAVRGGIPGVQVFHT